MKSHAPAESVMIDGYRKPSCSSTGDDSDGEGCCGTVRCKNVYQC